MPFVKGQSGNPGGRKKKAITLYLEEIGDEIELKSGKTFDELIARRLYVDAVNGNALAIREILNRREGMPQQKMDLTTEGKPLINVDYEHRRIDQSTAETDGGTS